MQRNYTVLKLKMLFQSNHEDIKRIEARLAELRQSLEDAMRKHHDRNIVDFRREMSTFQKRMDSQTRALKGLNRSIRDICSDTAGECQQGKSSNAGRNCQKRDSSSMVGKATETAAAPSSGRSPGGVQGSETKTCRNRGPGCERTSKYTTSPRICAVAGVRSLALAPETAVM